MNSRLLLSGAHAIIFARHSKKGRKCFFTTFTTTAPVFFRNAIHFRFHFTHAHRSLFFGCFDFSCLRSVYDEISTEILCGRWNTEHGWVINRLIKVFDSGKHHATAPEAKTT